MWRNVSVFKTLNLSSSLFCYFRLNKLKVCERKPSRIVGACPTSIPFPEPEWQWEHSIGSSMMFGREPRGLPLSSEVRSPIQQFWLFFIGRHLALLSIIRFRVCLCDCFWQEGTPKYLLFPPSLDFLLSFLYLFIPNTKRRLQFLPTSRNCFTETNFFESFNSILLWHFAWINSSLLLKIQWKEHDYLYKHGWYTVQDFKAMWS